MRPLVLISLTSCLSRSGSSSLRKSDRERAGCREKFVQWQTQGVGERSSRGNRPYVWTQLFRRLAVSRHCYWGTDKIREGERRGEKEIRARPSFHVCVWFFPRCLLGSQIAATGQEALEDLEELEMIFGAVSEIGGLERCTSLRSLTRKLCGVTSKKCPRLEASPPASKFGTFDGENRIATTLQESASNEPTHLSVSTPPPPPGSNARLPPADAPNLTCLVYHVRWP